MARLEDYVERLQALGDLGAAPSSSDELSEEPLVQ
jgi:hypothetical protein